MARTYQELLIDLAHRESSNRYDYINSLGYAGAYQFGEAALQAIGYYAADGTNGHPYDWNGGWTGKDGIDTLSEWLANSAVQDKAVGEWFKYLWTTEIKSLDLQKYVGQTINGVKITESGILAGAHLVGVGAVATYLNSGGSEVPADPSGTPVSEYIGEFSGYAVDPVFGTATMQINWLYLTQGPEGIPIPTYGEFGGPNWSGGNFVGDGEPGDYTVQPEDTLDQLFLSHDQAYDQPDTFDRALADIKLIQSIQALPADAVSGEGDLYAGWAVLAMLYQIAMVNKHPGLLLALDLNDTVQDAADLIAQGSISPEPNEVVGLVKWLGETAKGLADLVFPIILKDLLFDFISEDAFVFVTQAADASNEAPDLSDLGDLLGRDTIANLIPDAGSDAEAITAPAVIQDFLI
jgi:hypothetical protein